MIIGFMAANELHAIHVLHQKGMTKIGATGLCMVEEVIGQGVFQVPDWVFDGARSKYGEVAVCLKCAGAMRAMREPPKP